MKPDRLSLWRSAVAGRGAAGAAGVPAGGKRVPGGPGDPVVPGTPGSPWDATPASREAALDETLRSLVRGGFSEAEILWKSGRSRRLVRDLGGECSIFSEERAWAIRASSRRASFFVGGASGGAMDLAGGPWPDAAGRPFRLPEPVASPAWVEPADFAAPLIGEVDGLRLLEAIGRELATELPRARLLHAALEDGASETELASTRGVRVRVRRRLATLHLEAAGPGRPGVAAAIYLAAREARHFHPAALAGRLATRLAIMERSAAGAREPGGDPAAAAAVPTSPAGAALLAPPVAAALLAALLPLLLGAGAAERLAPLRDRRGRIGSENLTLIDNGRLAGGALECPFDGEGVATREVVLVERGTFRQPLLAWWQADGAAAGVASGCSRRASWRDLPLPGPTHLYLQPDPQVSVASLLAEVAHGSYLLDPTGPARYDVEGDRFVLPVCGFAVEFGRATAPLTAWLCGSAAALFKGLAGVARDLSFLPLDGMIGAPTLLVTGLELRPVP